MKKILVIGSGMVGSTIAADLAGRYEVCLADRNEDAFRSYTAKETVRNVVIDVLDENALSNLLVPFDLIVSAVPGSIGFRVLRSIINAGKNVVDISFFSEDAFKLDELAKEKKVTAVVDCGVAPGLCNLIAGYHFRSMKMNSYECLVGGLPVERKYPYEYKAVFSPADVIEEYVRPARYVENGKLITREALTDIELIDFEGIGTLESFNTDGLRSLAFTLNGVADMKEKTMRYPGHASLMHKMRASGFFSKKELIIGGKKITPLELTSALLFREWKYNKGDEDVTVMRVSITGNEKGDEVKYVYDLNDKVDRITGFSSMSRTTGFTCTGMVHLIAEKKYAEWGIIPPEYVGANEDHFRSILKHLEQHNVRLQCHKEFANEIQKNKISI